MSELHDDFAFEPVPGLPAVLPEGEHILWHGKPDPWSFAVAVMRLKAVAGAVVVLAIWRAMAAVHDGVGAMATVSTVATTLFSGGVVIALLAIAGQLMARSTIYTITNQRLVIRHGVAMQMAINIPFSRVTSAGADTSPPGLQGGGSVVLEMERRSRASLIALWPHARPFKIRHPEPAMRGLLDGGHVTAIVAEALRTSRSSEAVAPASAPAVEPLRVPTRRFGQPAEAA